MSKNTICLWYDRDAEAAARFYATVFPDSAVGAVHRAPSDYPSGKAGDVLTVEFTVAGVADLIGALAMQPHTHLVEGGHARQRHRAGDKDQFAIEPRRGLGHLRHGHARLAVADQYHVAQARRHHVGVEL